MRPSGHLVMAGFYSAGPGVFDASATQNMKSSNAYHRVFSYDTLEQSWRGLLRSSRPSSRNTVGYDGRSINDFARDPKNEIRKLIIELRTGEFNFSPLKPHLIPKANGKDRLICVPTVRDRIVQRALLEFLWEGYHSKLINSVSYGFIKQRTVHQAARIACKLRAKHPWVLKTDICSFFDQIDRDLLSREVKHLVRERSLHGILNAAMSCEISVASRNQQKRILKLGIKRDIGVRQGMPLSPLFSNVLLVPFDRELEKNRFHALRYADDLIFFTDSEDACKEILCKNIDLLDKLKLKLPKLDLHSKTEIYSPSDPAEFLGLGICEVGGTYSLRLLDKQRERIRDNILQMSSIRELISRRITLANIGAAISNRISGYISAYECCDNIDEFENELESLTKKVLRRIYQDELQIPLNNLKGEARAFLGI